MSTPQASGTLAIDGASPVRTRPFAPWPHYAEDQIEAVTRVLRSGKVNQWTGREVVTFEHEYAQTLGRRHAVALANGTLALELALIALDIGAGDEVIVPARTFIATASCVVMRGATPVVADVDLDTGGLSAATVEAAITDRTRAIIVVHLAGWPCDMDGIMALARARGLKVIEDCAQAHGATLHGRPVGSFGDLAAFSFCQDKIISTGGEGGLLVLDDDALWNRAWSWKDHGKDHETVFRTDHPVGFRWVHHSFGTNWRLTEMQAAIGRRQLAALPDWVATRRRLATRFRAAVAGLPAVHLPQPLPGSDPSWYRLYVRLDPQALAPGWTVRRVIEAVVAEGIPCQEGSCSEIYREQAFIRTGLGPRERLPVARQLGETSLMFLVHPTLEDADMDDAAAALTRVMQQAGRR
jgi:dTDP-4-amino-4,6-dideoxygalactose transaminase